MASSYVLKFPVADASGAAILLHVVPKGGNGLDLDLLATDGDAAFRGKGEIPGGEKLMYAANV